MTLSVIKRCLKFWNPLGFTLGISNSIYGVFYMFILDPKEMSKLTRINHKEDNLYKKAFLETGKFASVLMGFPLIGFVIGYTCPISYPIIVSYIWKSEHKNKIKDIR